MRKFLLRNPWAKGICVVLCCLLLGGYVGFGTLAYQFERHYGSNGSYEDIAGSAAASECQTNAWNLFTLDQHKDDLTYLGKQDYKRLSKALNQSNTNFRYRILSMDGKVLLDNLEGQNITAAVSQIYDNVYSSAESDYVEYEESSTSSESDGQETIKGTISYNQDYIRSKPKTFIVKNGTAPSEYVLEWVISSDLKAQDGLLDFQENSSRYSVLILPLAIGAIVCGVLCLLTFCWLMVAVGHKRDTQGIFLSRLHRCPYDLLLVLELILCSSYLSISIQILKAVFTPFSQHIEQYPLFFVTLTGLAALGGALGLPLCTTLAVQLKDHSFLQRTLIYRICRRCGSLCRQIPLNTKSFGTAFVFLLLYAFLCFLSGSNGSTFFLFLAFLMAVVALLALLWWLKGWKNIWTGGKALAEGNLSYVTDTDKIPIDLKTHGENLNAISKGMQKAVDQRIRSDRFRTELITNVSHDLKTPLTSIINYVDLLKKLQLDNETAQSYLDVLDRKSQRLKTLTEDLVEASKASAGVLSVDLQRVDTSQLVEQALAEYAEKLTAAQLSVLTQYPEHGAWIRADGRHLWRVLGNLLSNCAKYAMPGTRVYVDVVHRDGTVRISVKNISADPLNVPTEELLQRFVRGDAARTSEGSGLGISIAQSLVNLQGGKFRLQVDGDLFKATILFPEAP